MLISPAEPAKLRALGETSPTPELLGADFILDCPHSVVAVQRKEVSDLLASLSDGRLVMDVELLQQADVRVLLIEGVMQWTTNGYLLSTRSTFQKERWWGLQWSFLNEYGIWTTYTVDMDDTVRWLMHANRWWEKSTHRGITHGATTTGSLDFYQRQVLQAFPGVGSTLARRILDEFGRLPLALSVTDKELLKVKGVGSAILSGIKQVLGGDVASGGDVRGGGGSSRRRGSSGKVGGSKWPRN